MHSKTYPIHTYLQNLINGIYASKLSYANMFTNEEVKKIVDQYITELYPTTQNRLRKMLDYFTDLTQLHCKMYVRAISEPLLKAFYVKLYDHYKKTSDSERLAMQRYFNFKNDSTLPSMLVRGAVTDIWTCIQDNANILPVFKDPNFLPKVTLFKDSMDRMESFLQTARLEGNVFRYFTITS